MSDREKVVKGLELLANWPGGLIFTDKEKWIKTCCEMAVALLKEQEPVEPEAEVMNEIDRLYKCPKCHGYLFYDGQKYCDRCGQEVKWDDI